MMIEAKNSHCANKLDVDHLICRIQIQLPDRRNDMSESNYRAVVGHTDFHLGKAGGVQPTHTALPARGRQERRM